MQPCEYTKASTTAGSKRTKITTLGNIRFYRKIGFTTWPRHRIYRLGQYHFRIPNKWLSKWIYWHVQIKLPVFPLSPTVGKNRDTSPIIQMRWPTYKTSDPHFHGYKRKKVRNNFRRNSKKITAAAQILSKGQSGFGPMEMGAHSLRYRAAMAMYITEVSPLPIMIIRIWKIDASFLYIWKQAAHISTKVLDKMLQKKWFFTVPDFDIKTQEATNGYFPNSTSTPDIEKKPFLEHSVPGNQSPSTENTFPYIWGNWRTGDGLYLGLKIEFSAILWDYIFRRDIIANGNY